MFSDGRAHGFVRSRFGVFGVKLGMNPNSSSLGVDIAFLLAGSAALTAVTLVASTWLQLRRRRRAAQATTP